MNPFPKIAPITNWVLRMSYIRERRGIIKDGLAAAVQDGRVKHTDDFIGMYIPLNGGNLARIQSVRFGPTHQNGRFTIQRLLVRVTGTYPNLMALVTTFDHTNRRYIDLDTSDSTNYWPELTG